MATFESESGTIVTLGGPTEAVRSTTSWGDSLGIPVVDPGIPAGSFRSYGVSAELIWATQPSVRKTTGFIARNMAAMSWKAYLRGSDDDRQRLASSPAERAFKTPRRFQPGYSLLERFILDWLLYDSACMILLDGVVTRVPPRMLVPAWDAFGNITALGVRMPSGIVDLSSTPTAFLTGWTEVGGTGTSPLRTIAAILEESSEAVEWRRSQWRTTPKIDGIVTRPADAPKWMPDSRDRWIESWKQYRDGLNSSGQPMGTPIFEDGMNYVPMGSQLKPVDAQDVEGRTLTDAEVAAFYFIPPELVGARAGNFASIAAFRQMLYGPALGPYITAVEQALNAEIVPALAASGDRLPAGSIVYVEADRDAAMDGSFLEQASFVQSAVGGPWMLRSEARARFNLPYVDGTDALITPMNVTEGGLASPNDTGSQNEDASAPDQYPHTSSAPRGAIVTKAADSSIRGRMERALKAVHKRQAEDVESVTDEDAWHKKWDPEVAAAIRPVLWAAAVSGAQQVTARTKADAWTPEKMRGYIKAMAASKAQRINAGSWQIIENLNTVDQDDEDEDEPHSKSSLFMDAVKGVAVAWAAAAVTDALGFGAHDAATGNGLTTKTWVVTSQNPRPEHAALDGETVGVDETFSNGGRWPGDGLNLDVDDVAGCTCVLQYAW